METPTVSGTTTTVNPNVVNIGDSTLTLNSDETGAPHENGGIEIERGTLKPTYPHGMKQMMNGQQVHRQLLSTHFTFQMKLMTWVLRFKKIS